jgi:hypothetical protein
MPNLTRLNKRSRARASLSRHIGSFVDIIVDTYNNSQMHTCTLRSQLVVLAMPQVAQTEGLLGVHCSGCTMRLRRGYALWALWE